MTNYVSNETICQLREWRHLTQRELAERLNVSDISGSKDILIPRGGQHLRETRCHLFD